MSDDTFYQTTRLANGLQVISEHVPGVRSVSLGIWIRTGSRDESSANSGITHFLEHLIFKGTPSRSAKDIAETFDSIGGELNAFSAKEYTCVYSRVIDRHLDIAIDVLSDLVSNPIFKQEDIDSERAVVLEEINMHEDAPSELVHDIFDQALFNGHPLGPRIIGTAKTINSMTRERISEYWAKGYTTPNIVVAAAGNVGHNSLVRQIEAAFCGERPGRRSRRDKRLHVASGVRVEHRDTQQAHICFGVEGIGMKDGDRFALSVIDAVLGGGMSSRLFQSIREKRGLAYSVYSFRSQYAETGSMAVYAGTAPENANRVLSLIVKEFERVAAKGITAKELSRTKEQLKGSTVLGLEDVTTRMNRLGRGLLCGTDIYSMDELIEKVDAVNMKDIKRVAAEVFSRPRVLTVIGPFESNDFERFVKGA